MTDRNYKKLEEGQIGIAKVYGHTLNIEIYEIEDEKVFFRTLNHKSGQPRDSYFNRIEAQRYLTILDNYLDTSKREL